MNSPLLDKSLDFATQVVLFYEDFSKTKKIQQSQNSYFVLMQVLVQI